MFCKKRLNIARRDTVWADAELMDVIQEEACLKVINREACKK